MTITPKYSIVLLAITTLLVAGLSGCCKKKEYCPSEPLKIALIGFYRTEIKLINIKRYKKWHLEQLIDSATLSYNGPTKVPRVGEDTVWLSDYITIKGLLNSIQGGNDWEINIWGARRTHLITELTDAGYYYELIRCSDKKTSCQNPITGFKIDGTLTHGNTLYIRKVH